MKGLVATGAGMLLRERDLLGIGLAWGRPHASGLRDQYTMELFYRIQLLKGFALTPNIQLIVDPALNRSETLLSIFGVKARLAF